MILSKKELAAKIGARLECPARGAMHRGTADPSPVIEKCRSDLVETPGAWFSFRNGCVTWGRDAWFGITSSRWSEHAGGVQGRCDRIRQRPILRWLLECSAVI